MSLNLVLKCLNNNNNLFFDPIYKLMNTIDKVTKIQQENSLYSKFFLFNWHKINNLLYENEKIINVDYIKFEGNIAFYFYLVLLIKKSEYMINYQFPFDLIKNIDEEKNLHKEDDCFFILIKSKIILCLIENFIATEKYDEKYNEELEKMKEKHIRIINENSEKIKGLYINLGDNILLTHIEDIYINIIISLMILKYFIFLNYE